MPIPDGLSILMEGVAHLAPTRWFLLLVGIALIVGGFLSPGWGWSAACWFGGTWFVFLAWLYWDHEE